MSNHDQCAAKIDHWQQVRCPEPVDGRDGGCFCTLHAIDCCLEQMAEAVKAGDHELAAEYAASLAQLGATTEVELAKAA